MPSSSRFLVAGAGDVGLTLATVLSEAGLEVATLNRSGRSVEGATALVADLRDLTSLKSAIGEQEFDVLVITTAPARRSDGAYRAAYVDGPANLLATLSQHPARAVLTSTTGVYGDDDGRWITASTPPNPTRSTAEIVLDGEQRLAGKVPTTVVRAAGIYGPGRTHLIDRVRDGQITVDGSTEWTNRIHRDDLVSALALAAVHPSPPALAIAVDDEPAPHHVVTAWLAEELGVEPPAKAGTESTTTGKRCRNSELKDMGWEPAYPSFREGYRSVLATI